MKSKCLVFFKCKFCGWNYSGITEFPEMACEQCGALEYKATAVHVSDDAIDQANLKLALMQHDAERVNKKMEEIPSFFELSETLLKTLALTAFGFLCLALAVYLLKEFK